MAEKKKVENADRGIQRLRHYLKELTGFFLRQIIFSSSGTCYARKGELYVKN